MLKFENCTFSAAGADKNAKVYGLTTLGAEDVVVNRCTFDGTGYSGLLNKGTGTLTVTECVFECDGLYNPIEGGQSADNGAVTIEDCEFKGVPGNNFINFYQVADGTTHTIKGCSFAGGTANNIIRLSNKNNAAATFNISDCSYKFTSGIVDEYTGFILCQDYTNKTGTHQDFSKYDVKITNLNRPEEGSLIYVYEDGAGILKDNYPTTWLDGKPVIWESGASIIVSDEDEDF